MCPAIHSHLARSFGSMTESGYGRALGVIGALAAHPQDIEVDSSIDAAFRVIDSSFSAHDDDDDAGTSAALSFLANRKLSRAECCQRARAARRRRVILPTEVVKKIDKFNATQACRVGDRTSKR